MQINLGPLPEKWAYQPLKLYCIEHVHRAGLSTLPILTVSKDRGIILQSEKFKKRIASSNTERYKRVERGQFAYDPMLLWSGSIARQTRVEEGIVSPAYTTFRVTNEIHHDYLIQLLKWPRLLPVYADISVGTNVRRRKASFQSFCALTFPLPPLAEQKKIAAILSSVDEAIQKTEAVIKQTKKVKEGLLQELLTKGIGPDGRPHTRFKDSPIGRIPEGWEVKRLGELMRGDLRNGYSPVSPVTPTGHWVLSLASLSGHGLNPKAIKIAPAGISSLHSTELRKGDFLISRANTPSRVGYCAVFRGEVERCSYPDLMMRFRIQEERVDEAYLEHYLRSHPVRMYIKGRAAGTNQSMVKITGQTVRKLPVALPSIDEQRSIAQTLQQQVLSVQGYERVLASLKSLKAGLLQDLLTGKVRVKV